MSSDVCKHCTLGRVPGGLPDRGAVPHRVRHRRRAARHLQRLRLLRARLPVRRDRPARGRRPGLQVHPLLRPAARTAWSRPARRPARPSRSSSASSTSCASGPGRGWPRCTTPGVAEARLYGEDEDDGVGGAGRVLPAAGRARGLRPAARPGVHHPRPAHPVAGGRARRRDPGGRGGRRVRWRAAGERARRRRPRGTRVRGSVVPEAEFRSYYGRPILKEPVWTLGGPLVLLRRRPGRGLGLARAGGPAERATTGWPGAPAPSRGPG